MLKKGTFTIKQTGSRSQPLSFYDAKIENFIKDNNMDIEFIGYNIDSPDEWNGAKTKLVLKCPKHGVFDTVTINAFTNKSEAGRRSCPECGKQSSIDKQTFMTNEEFIKRVSEKHNYKYDYSKTEFTGYDKDIIVTCPEHGDFTILASSHMYRKSGCKLCRKNNTNNDIQEQSIKKIDSNNPGHYDFSKFKYSSKLDDNGGKVTLICKEHNEEFTYGIQTVREDGFKCPICEKYKREEKQKLIEEDARLAEQRKKKERAEYFADYIRRCKEVHGDKYTIVDVYHERTTDKIHLRCPIHGDFYQQADSFVKGHGCSECGNKRLSTEQFIERVEALHPGEFEFPEDLVYVNAHTPVTLYCKEHKGYFTIIPNKILHQGAGCNVCNRGKHTQESFIAKCKENYGDLYSYDKTVYTKSTEKVTVYCNEHKDYVEIYANTLLKGETGCPHCAHHGVQLNFERFVERANKTHDGKYTYIEEGYINASNKVRIICPEHGEFTQLGSSHISGQGCPLCAEYGFRPNKPGFFYVQKLTNEHKTVYKFGITNNIKVRMSQQKRDSVFEHELVYSKEYDVGQKALDLENYIKELFKTSVVESHELPSGWTETIEESEYESLMNVIEEYNKYVK